jgi:hypothetical protein
MKIDRNMGMGTAYFRTPITVCQFEKTLPAFPCSYLLGSSRYPWFINALTPVVASRSITFVKGEFSSLIYRIQARPQATVLLALWAVL